MALTPTDWSHYVTIPESYIPASSTTGQTLVITEATIAKLSAGDQTIFWSNVLNGGGDVRICTDVGGVNQLPVDLVSLDNVGETCVIWTRKATYAGTGDLFLFIGKAGETQPLPGAAFGRNAVWVDYNLVTHDGVTDSSGNTTLTPTNITSSTGLFSNAANFNGVSSRIDATISPTFQGGTLQSWLKLDRSVDQSFLSIANSAVTNQQLRSQTRSSFVESNAFDGASTLVRSSTVLDPSTTIFQMVHSVYSPTFKRTYHTGGNEGSATQSYSISGIDRLTIGVTADSTPLGFFSGDACEVWYTENLKSANEIATEYANQANQSTFFGTPTITAIVGGGVTATITESSPAFADSINTSVTGATNTAQITELLPAFIGSVNATVTGNLTANITEQSPSFNGSVTASVVAAGVVSANIIETAPTFTGSISATLTQIRLAEITGQAAAFSDIVNVSISGIISSSISESAPAFSASLTATVPGQWTDVVVPGATWTDRTNTQSTWVNIR